MACSAFSKESVNSVPIYAAGLKFMSYKTSCKIAPLSLSHRKGDIREVRICCYDKIHKYTC